MEKNEESPQKDLNEVSNLSDIEIRVMIIKMLKEFSKNYKELSGNYINMAKDIETMNKNQPEIKNTICDINNTLKP